MIHLFMVSVSLLFSLSFGFLETSRLAALFGKSLSFCFSSVSSEKCFIMFDVLSFPRYLCWDAEFKCIDSSPLFSYFS